MAKAFQNVARVGRNIVKFGHTGWKQKKSRHFSRSKFAADGEYSFIIYFNVRVNRFRGENHQTSGRFHSTSRRKRIAIERKSGNLNALLLFRLLCISTKYYLNRLQEACRIYYFTTDSFLTSRRSVDSGTRWLDYLFNVWPFKTMKTCKI